MFVMLIIIIIIIIIIIVIIIVCELFIYQELSNDVCSTQQKTDFCTVLFYSLRDVRRTCGHKLLP